MNNLLNFKSFLKFLSKNKAYTAIDVFGLSVSLMFVILIAVYTVQELSIDNFQENRERIYVIAHESGDAVAIPIAYRLQERYPEIERVCPVVFNNISDLQVFYGDRKLKAEACCADSSFFSFFSFRLLAGNSKQVLNDQYDAVLSETFARKMFGSEDPVGKSLRISDSTSVIVTGVMADIRRSIVPYKDMVIRLERAQEFNGSLSMTNDGNAGSTTGFLMMHEGADLRLRTDDILEYFKEYFWPYKLGVWKEVRIIPMKDIYFSEKPGYSSLEHGDKLFILVLMSVGILILIFAVFNYINLTVAQAGQRAKEMATRRLLGSSRMELFLRLMMESTLMTLFSFLFGLLLAMAAVPFANSLLDTRIVLSDAFTPAYIGAAVVLILLIGVLSGLLPALLISASKPIDVVRGTFRRRTKMVFSKCFITIQNIITIAILAAALVMGLQINHMIEAPLGYNTANILAADNTCRSDNERAAVLDGLRQLPCVKSVGMSEGTPFNGGNNLTGKYEGKSLSFQQLVVDSAAFNMFGLQIKQDNHVASSDNWSWYLTERAFRDMELPEDAKVFHLNENAVPILGVLKDFHLHSVIDESSPLMLRFRDFNKPNSWPWNILVEVQGNPYTAYREVSEVFEQVTKIDFEGKYIDQQIQERFESQIRMVKIVVIFACVAILISLLGLLAMSTYFIQQRSQEIAIRKVFGSDDRSILIRLVGTFLMYVVIAFVIATPVSWYFMKQWLSDYSYRISLSPLIFIAAGLFCLVISFFSVFFQSWRAANANPVESVKDN
ncbi:ABC transporter permease [Parabacteroides sp. AF17-28]|uniref:ABC transporter permease n=2 Tax=Parabacteroides TaxID=375288 RepID=UPI000EFF7B6A|nr:ABC transporter permease [Parabacteroides sp. AF17-28]RHR61689.1 ABC transporter permease [Parabacteroides sp. AF17-28]